jgi:nickel-dependent lactate racemase
MKFTLPYDKKTIDVEIDDRNLIGVLESKVEGYKPAGSQEELIEASLDSPIGSPKLEELAKGKKNIVIISSTIRVLFPQRSSRRFCYGAFAKRSPMPI